MTYLQAFMILSLPVTGMCYAALGALKLPLTDRLKLDEAKVGWLIASFGFMVGPMLTFSLLVAAGLITGPFFPNLMALLLTHFPAEVHGRAIGMLFAMASVGWTVIPSIMGAVAKRKSVPHAFLVAAACTLILLGLVITHHFHAR